jgi:hypothetical protein
VVLEPLEPKEVHQLLEAREFMPNPLPTGRHRGRTRLR